MSESGKSSLLKVLYGLKPAAAPMPAFTLARDFPRDRPRRNFSDSIVVAETSWELTAEEQARVGSIWARGTKVKTVTARRSYKQGIDVAFPEATALSAWVPILDGQRRVLEVVAANTTASPPRGGGMKRQRERRCENEFAVGGRAGTAGAT